MTAGLVRRFVENQRQASPRFRVRKPPRSQFPGSAERGYRRYLLGLVDAVKKDIDEILVPLIPGLVRVASGRADAPRYNIEDIEGTLSTATEDIEGRLDNQHLRNLEEKVEQYRGETSTRVTRDLRRQIRSMISLDAFPQAGTAERVQSEAYLTQNVKLIKSLTGDYVSQVEDMVRRGVQSGDRPKVIQDKVQSRWGVSRNRAELIARDQIGKLRGNLTRIRQTSLGLDKYIWRTSRDERVRPSHLAKEGEIFEWDDPPSDTGHPGQDYQCRCTAEPFIENEPAKEEGAVFGQREFAIAGIASGLGTAAAAPLVTAAGAAGAAANVAATGAVLSTVPAAAWSFAGPPWPVSPSTPTAPFSGQQLAKLIQEADFTAQMPTAAQAAMRQQLNAVLAGAGLTNRGLVEGMAEASGLQLEDVSEIGLAGYYNNLTGAVVMDRPLMRILSGALARGEDLEQSPIFHVMIHEAMHSTTPLVKFGEIRGINTLVEELSNQAATEAVLFDRFGVPQALFTDPNSSYGRWAQATRDAIRDAYDMVDFPMSIRPTAGEVQEELSKFLVGLRREGSFTNPRQAESAFREGFFPDKFMPGMTESQKKRMRAKLMRAWRILMYERGIGDF